VAYDVGQVYQTYIDVTDEDGNPATPSAAVLTVSWRNASGPQTSAFALSPGPDQGALPAPVTEGRVFYDWTFTEPALYKFAWVTQGPGAATSDFVSARDYIAALPLAEAADWLGVRDQRQFPKLRAALALATRLGENVVGPTVPRRYVDDWIPGNSRDLIRVSHAPLPDNASVEQVRSVYPGGPLWVTGDLVVNPAAGTLRPRSQLPFYYGPWLATYTAGRLEVSPGIEGGIREILWDLWATQRYVFGDTLDPDLADVASYESRLPPGWAPPRRAMELFGDDAQPSFG
jgi:hypothetical protein